MTQSPTEDVRKAQPRDDDESAPLLPPSHPAPLPPPSTELSGYALMAASCIGFSGMSFMVHIAEDRYDFPASSAVFIRGIFHTVLSFLYIVVLLPFPQTFTNISKTQWKLLTLRGLSGALGIFVFFVALQKLPVGDAVTLFFCGPVMVMILSNAVLNEPITTLDILAAVTSFIGIILIARPDFGVSVTVSTQDRFIGVVCGLTAAFLSSVAYVTIRSLGTRVHFTLSMLALGVGSVFVSIMLGGALGPVGLVAKKEGALLVALAALSAFAGQGCLTRGLQLCRAGPGILIRNLDVPIAYILGIFFLAESPTLLRLFGSTLVLFSAFIIGVRQIVQP